MDAGRRRETEGDGQMDLDLKGRRALITGGTRGIGRAIAAALLAEGVRVMISGRSAETAAAAAAELAAATGGEVHAEVADTQKDADVDALVARTVTVLGGLDIVVNNAARPSSPPSVPGVGGVSSEQMLEELNTKVVGYLRVARAAAPHLVAAGWGRIINISGLGARMTGSIPTSVRNVGVAALTKCLADELGPKGINVTVVHPAGTRTERTADMVAARARADGISPAEAEKTLFGGSLIGRIVEADEVAAVVAFLCSPRSVAINGDAVAVGGGIPRAIYY